MDFSGAVMDMVGVAVLGEQRGRSNGWKAQQQGNNGDSGTHVVWETHPNNPHTCMPLQLPGLPSWRGPPEVQGVAERAQCAWAYPHGPPTHPDHHTLRRWLHDRLLQPVRASNTQSSQYSSGSSWEGGWDEAVCCVCLHHS